MSLLITLVSLALIVLALIDVIRQPDPVIKNLHKVVWVLLIVFVPLIGVLVWFILGHDWKREDGGSFLPGGNSSSSSSRSPRGAGQWRRPWGPKASPAGPFASSPAPPPFRPAKSTEEQLADLEREEELYRRLAEQQRAEREKNDGPVTP